VAQAVEGVQEIRFRRVFTGSSPVAEQQIRVVVGANTASLAVPWY
jgi:hypothetical protein